MAKTVILAENVSKIFDMGAVKVKALDNISLEIKEGDYVSIMGPSGSGKTTLLDIVSALMRPTHGDVFISGKPISKMNDTELAVVRGKTIGFVFQTFNLISRMTALENVMLPLWLQDVPEKKRNETALQTLKDVGLGDRVKHRPNQLSGGERQRVAIARALAVNPSVIVADEPTGNLDSASGEQIMKIIKGLHENKNKTIVMVTHEKSLGEMAEKTIFLKDGKIVKIQKN